MTNATAISRLLRKAGYGVVTTRLREGLLVTRSSQGATVTAQFDLESKAVRRAHDVAAYLREQGFTVEGSGYVLAVTRL